MAEIKIGAFTGDDSNFFKSNKQLENGTLVNAEKLAQDLLKSKKVYVKPHRAGAHQVKGFYRTDTRGKKAKEKGTSFKQGDRVEFIQENGVKNTGTVMGPYQDDIAIHRDQGGKPDRGRGATVYVNPSKLKRIEKEEPSHAEKKAAAKYESDPKNVHIGDTVEDYNGEEWEVKGIDKAENIEDLKPWDDSGIIGDMLNDPESYGYDAESIKKATFVAVESKEHGSAVFVYGEDGVQKKKGEPEKKSRKTMNDAQETSIKQLKEKINHDYEARIAKNGTAIIDFENGERYRIKPNGDASKIRRGAQPSIEVKDGKVTDNRKQTYIQTEGKKEEPKKAELTHGERKSIRNKLLEAGYNRREADRLISTGEHGAALEKYKEKRRLSPLPGGSKLPGEKGYAEEKGTAEKPKDVFPPSKETDRVLQNHFSRKPVDDNDIGKTLKMSEASEDLKKFVGSLKTYEAKDVLGDNWVKDLKKPTENYFIVNKDGNKYLVDTEGYSYPRYVTKLDTSEKKEESKEKMKSSHRKFWEKMKQGAYMKKKKKEKMGNVPPPSSSPQAGGTGPSVTPTTGIRG